MGTVGRIAIILLVLIIIGILIAPDMTEQIVRRTGNAVLDVGREAVDRAAQSDIVRNVTEPFQELIITG